MCSNSVELSVGLGVFVSFSTLEKKQRVLYCEHMTRITISFELGQKVSSTLSILLILLLSVLVALLTLRAAQNVIDMTESSPVFHIEKRAGGAAMETGK